MDSLFFTLIRISHRTPLYVACNSQNPWHIVDYLLTKMSKKGRFSNSGLYPNLCICKSIWITYTVEYYRGRHFEMNADSYSLNVSVSLRVSRFQFDES